jgi:hypothetical protein
MRAPLAPRGWARPTCASRRADASPASLPAIGRRHRSMPSHAAGGLDANRTHAVPGCRSVPRGGGHRGRADSDAPGNRPDRRPCPGRPGSAARERAGHSGGHRVLDPHRHRGGLSRVGGAGRQCHGACDAGRLSAGGERWNSTGRRHLDAQLRAGHPDQGRATVTGRGRAAATGGRAARSPEEHRPRTPPGRLRVRGCQLSLDSEHSRHCR